MLAVPGGFYSFVVEPGIGACEAHRNPPESNLPPPAPRVAPLSGLHSSTCGAAKLHNPSIGVIIACLAVS